MKIRHDTPLFDYAKREKEAHKGRSIENTANASSSLENIKKFGHHPKKRRAVFRIGMKPKNISLHESDWLILHRYAEMRKMYICDVLHELIEPLNTRIANEHTLL